MGFIERAADGALALTMDRIRRRADHGLADPIPGFDPKQARELREEQRGGRTDEPYRQCLEYHGFAFVPAHLLPAYSEFLAHEEGEWRHPRMRLAFTPGDLAAGFPGGPGDLDRFLREHLLSLRAGRARVPKAEVRKILGRR